MTKGRIGRGNSTLEFPVALVFFLLAVLFPLIDLASIYLGANAVYSAARVAAVAAAKANNTANIKNIAQATATAASTNTVNIPVSAVSVTFLRTQFAPDPSQGDPSTDPPTPPPPAPDPPVPQDVTNLLPIPVDTTCYLYQVRVTVTGSVSGLVMMSPGLLGSIQGVTVPIQVTATNTVNLENPNALGG